MARSAMSMQSVSALLAAVIAVSLTVFGLLLILLDATVFRPASEAARLRAEARHQARLAAQAEGSSPSLIVPAAERSDGVAGVLPGQENPLPTPMPAPVVLVMASPGGSCGSGEAALGMSVQEDPFASLGVTRNAIPAVGVAPSLDYGDGGRDALMEAYRNARAGKKAAKAGAAGPLPPVRVTLGPEAAKGLGTAAGYRRAAMARAGAAALVAAAKRRREKAAARMGGRSEGLRAAGGPASAAKPAGGPASAAKPAGGPASAAKPARRSP